MDMKRMKDDDKLYICKRYFYGGFALLPFLWIVNSIWFFEEAFLSSRQYPEKPQIRKLVILSLIAGTVSLLILSAWVVYFQENRASADWGDSLSLFAPEGIP
ncbi:presenilin enhancer, gamma-secretase subunit [Brevipalpus obovatus]|uniref:presenilin enhancer, gamma-secretase subunit n=1 Tax=Brevipalpus obovatus TaxID=246614 RepID=UPI003D9EFDEC